MESAVHYVGFRDDRYLAAWRVFGGPRIIHRWWDRRARREIGEDDVIVFASGNWYEQTVSERNAPDLTEEEPTP